MHSHDKCDVARGLELVAALLSSDSADRRELLYLRGVAQFRQRHNMAARTTLKEALTEYPDFRQAESLLDAVESEIVKDGLVGVGAGAALLGVVGAIAIAAMKKR